MSVISGERFGPALDALGKLRQPSLSTLIQHAADLSQLRLAIVSGTSDSAKLPMCKELKNSGLLEALLSSVGPVLKELVDSGSILQQPAVHLSVTSDACELLGTCLSSSLEPETPAQGNTAYRQQLVRKVGKAGGRMLCCAVQMLLAPLHRSYRLHVFR